MIPLDIQIWSDVVCPWCAIGKAHLDEALADFPHPVAITWRSFELDPTAARTSDVPLPELLGRKYGAPPAQVQQMMSRVASMAARRGLRFDLDHAKPGNTFDAHRLLHLARAHGCQQALAERLFRAYLTDGEAIGEPSTLRAHALAVGLPADAVDAVLAGDAHGDAVRADQAAARANNIQGVPFFVFGGRYAVSGAQPPEVLRQALDRAWAEGPGATVGGDDACGPDGCAI